MAKISSFAPAGKKCSGRKPLPQNQTPTRTPTYHEYKIPTQKAWHIYGIEHNVKKTASTHTVGKSINPPPAIPSLTDKHIDAADQHKEIGDCHHCVEDAERELEGGVPFNL